MIRYAIWSAVSTEAQARKVSLDAQVDLCREAATKRGWVENTGPYVVRGESRTAHLDLRDAETAIPELHQMLEAAKRGEIDVVVAYDYTRFRELLDQVARALSHYKTQMWSVSQGGEVQDPATYSPYKDGASGAMRAIYKIQSSGEISATRNRYQFGMPRRTLAGYAPSRLPFGYRKPPGQETNSKIIPIQDTVQAAAVLRIKDLFLAGQSSNTICDILNAEGVRPMKAEKWIPSSVLKTISNPFYSGVVRFGRYNHFLDLRAEGKDKHYKRVNPSPTIGKGLHVPLWDEATQEAINAELKRRRDTYWKGPHKAHALSGLLVCGKCGGHMNADSSGNKASRYKYVYRCRNSNAAERGQHASIGRKEAERMVGLELARILKETTDFSKLSPVAQGDNQERVRAALAELTERRARIEDGYEKGAYQVDSFLEKTLEIDQQSAALREQLAGSEQAEIIRRGFVSTAESLKADLDSLPEWISGDDPMLVNKTLSQLIDHVVITKKEPPVITFR